MKAFIFKPSLQTFKTVTAISLVSFVLLYFLLLDGRYKSEIQSLKRVVLYRDEFINELSGPKGMLYPVAKNYKRKDWNDYKFIEYEKSREGPGENGKPFELTDPVDIALNKKLFRIEGLYVIVSDKISVNRSVPDTRMPK